MLISAANTLAVEVPSVIVLCRGCDTSSRVTGCSGHGNSPQPLRSQVLAPDAARGAACGLRRGVALAHVAESACACSDCVNTQLVRNYRRHAHFVISVSAVNFSCQLFRPFLYSVKKYLAHSTQCKKKR